ncbi:MAG: cobalamin [Firmicutes bacterium]|nr:cobalamin [Bacillota bacterium]
MHIPDGYLSPSTCATLGVVMVPIWYRASTKLKDTLDISRIPLLAMGAVFSFLIMMFNIPIPDGTTAHAIGAALLAIILGPWAAVFALSITLVIQSLVFGDGGILALGANAFNMAFIAPFVGYYVYRLINGKALPGSNRQLIAGGVASYVAINAAALAAAIEFGLQPLLFVAPDGTPLYCPYDLTVTLPAMMLAHLTLAGIVEGIVTTATLKFLANQAVDSLTVPTEPRKEV